VSGHPNVESLLQEIYQESVPKCNMTLPPYLHYCASKQGGEVYTVDQPSGVALHCIKSGNELRLAPREPAHAEAGNLSVERVSTYESPTLQTPVALFEGMFISPTAGRQPCFGYFDEHGACRIVEEAPDVSRVRNWT